MSDLPGMNRALLEFCANVNGAQGGDSAAVPRRSEEEWAWLRNALAAAELPGQILQKKVRKLADFQSMTEDELCAILEEVQDFVEDLNSATDFNQMNGPRLMLHMLREMTSDSNKSRVRALCAQIISSCCQNFEPLQQALNQTPWTEVLLPLLASEADAAARHYLAFAVSSIVKSNPRGTAKFVSADGLSAVHSALSRATEVDDLRSMARLLQLTATLAAQGVSSLATIDQACNVVSLMAARMVSETPGASALDSAQSGNVVSNAARMLLIVMERDSNVAAPRVQSALRRKDLELFQERCKVDEVDKMLLLLDR